MDNKLKIDLKDGYTVNEDGAVLYKGDVVLSQHQAEAIIRLIGIKFINLVLKPVNKYKIKLLIHFVIYLALNSVLTYQSTESR